MKIEWLKGIGVKNTHIAPASIESMLEELGENENIIVLTDERKLYVPTGWSRDTFETTCANFIMITRCCWW